MTRRPRARGFSPEQAQGIWRMLQVDQPDATVLANNETHTVKKFVQETFGHVPSTGENTSNMTFATSVLRS